MQEHDRHEGFKILFACWSLDYCVADRLAAFAFLNSMLFVPSNPDLTDRQNLGWKIGSAVLCALVAYLFFPLSRLAFRKAKGLGSANAGRNKHF
jgi:hypothetical protein